MATSYRTILIHPGARSFTSAGLIARFPMSMVGISTILAVEELYGSYTAAGLVSAANFVATALCTTPFLPVTSGWVCCVVMQLFGGLWFLSQRATEPSPHPTRPRSTTEADEQSNQATAHPPVMRYGAMVSIAIVFLILGALFGANDVAAVAFATEAGHKSASGLVLAVWGVGSFGAALLYGSRTWGWPLWKQLMVGLVGLAVGASTFGFAPSLVVLSVLALLTGLAIAPTLTSGNNIVQVTVAPSQLTEGLAWVSTALNIGVSIGSLLAGQATDAGGSRAGYLAVAAFAWGAVVVGVLGLPALRRARTSGSLGGH